MNRNPIGALGVLVVVLLVTAVSALFTVYQTQQALVVRFGELIRVITEPGLPVKLPWFDTVIYINKRILDLENRSAECWKFARKNTAPTLWRYMSKISCPSSGSPRPLLAPFSRRL